MNFFIKIWEAIKKVFAKNDNSKKSMALQSGNKKSNRQAATPIYTTTAKTNL